MISSKDAPRTAKGTLYSISFDREEWSAKKDQRSDYVFENKKDGRILLSNSFCEEFQDQPLDKLAGKTFKNIQDFKSSSERYTTFNDREAYRIQGSGVVDGVKVVLQLLNTRRDNCYFDFLAISPEGTDSSDTAFNEFISKVVFK